jgi:CubicO group peptidase (beta-lactamase class C family)
MIHRLAIRVPALLALALASLLGLSAFPTVASADETSGRETIADPALRELVELLESRASKIMPRRRVPGAGVAILTGGEIAWAGGFGFADVKTERPVTGDTVFNIGSISKTVAAWGLLRLVEAGKLDLDTPVEKVLTRWKLPPSAFDHDLVTLRRLLSHTAGLSLHGYPGFQPGEKLPTIEESLSGATNGPGDVRVILEPGTLWKYSGGGYTISQLLLEEVSGKAFADFMREEVLVPLGMTSSDYVWTEEITRLAATPYDQRGNAIPGPRFTALAAAGLQTTPRDLARFARASMAPLRRKDDPATWVLKPETLELMQSSAQASPNYGLGYMISENRGIRVVGHGGANDGWMARLDIVPDTGDGLVVLTNGTNGSDVHQILFQLWVEWLAEKQGHSR